MTSIRNLLYQHPIEASAPCRIDSGGTWDIKAMALPLQSIDPVTVNVALSLRTIVTLSPYKDNRIQIESDGFPHSSDQRKENISFEPPFGIFFAAVSYFGYHGLRINILSQSPVKSALGGSSTALVALIKALAKVRSIHCPGEKMSPKKNLHLAYHLEDGISGGGCGIQDQAAAVYGGVHQWRWRYGKPSNPFERIRLLDQRGQQNLSERLLVAYSGKAHVSLRTNRKWIQEFLSGKTRNTWIEVNATVHKLAAALKAQNWSHAAAYLRKEMALRKEATPEALIPIMEQLIRQAEKMGCGARFTGAGAGGSLWALGKKYDIRRLKTTWEKTLKPIKGAGLLDCRVDSSGVK